VYAVKKFLDDTLAKYDTLKELKLAFRNIGQLFKNQQAFANAKRKDTGGVGEKTIKEFLGGNWGQIPKITLLHFCSFLDGDIGKKIKFFENFTIPCPTVTYGNSQVTFINYFCSNQAKNERGLQ